MYKLTVIYDDKIQSVHQFSDALTAVHAFDKCVDFGMAENFATYNLSEPSGKMHTKWFSRNGNSGGK